MNYQKRKTIIKNQKNTFEFKYKNQTKNNRYKNYFKSNKEILDFNIKTFEQLNINEKRYKELKDKYFLYSRYI